ncbi:eukaryotic translation initiation factor 2D isoform X1 [Leptidea sinapis]|uniref:eukaryotic translation initiation factor 2D isoform X1 n=2 Tax=Leptidea sinapis TaxID=189913 RepID=UPI002132809C|nr:eukaryotic translation initiation factor 2D isoform X1 [Leptidea sinapis]
MFAKPYKLKSNNTLKNTEKKHLLHRLQNAFPAAEEDKIKELIPIKSTSSLMKLIVHSGDTVGVYVVDSFPIMIEIEETLIPTVCALWKYPELIPNIVIHSPVLNKVKGGAPLYVPGVVTDPSHFPRFSKGSLVSASTTDNAAACIVGKATMSSGDLLVASMGVCMDILHVFGDLLCKEIKFSKIERPKFEHIIASNIDNITVSIDNLNIHHKSEEWPSLVRTEPAPVRNEPRVIVEPPEPERIDEKEGVNSLPEDDSFAAENSDIEDTIPSDMDGLLRWCLLSFLRVHGSHIELPLKTNLLYKKYLMPFCPEDRTLDVKKSTYKKMGKFLEAMQREGLVEVRELEPGVDALTNVSVTHPAVRAHPVRVAPASTPAPDALDYVPPVVRELYCVTAHVADLLAPHRKGTALATSEVRAAVREYVKARQLDANKGAPTLDATLARAAGKREQEQVKWDELMNSILGRMTASTEMRYADGTTKIVKTKLDPIKMQVVTRSGNKKVTLVSNLEPFGFVLVPLAQQCQRAVGASCGVTRAASATSDQLMLQGDQTHFMAKLLIEKYGLPKKFVEGADKALNKKK